jgi:hypothetical protein
VRPRDRVRVHVASKTTATSAPASTNP